MKYYTMLHITGAYLLTIILSTTKLIQNQFCRNKQEANYYITLTLSYDKKSFRNADVKKGFGKCFLILKNIENKFLANSSKQPLF